MNDMEAKFTKREWAVITEPESEHYLTTVDCGGIMQLNVITSATDITFTESFERIANAHLIAAAPNLYHALKRTNEELALLIDLYNKKVKDPAHFIDAETCYLNNIELAKARGE